MEQSSFCTHSSINIFPDPLDELFDAEFDSWYQANLSLGLSQGCIGFKVGLEFIKIIVHASD